MKHVAIIGGGASGIFSALYLKKLFNNQIDITIFEKNSRIGRKILASGNGKCNLSNQTLLVDNIYNNEFATKIYNEFPPIKLREYLDTLGLFTKLDQANRVYPQTESSNSVLDLMLLHLKNANVIIKTEETVLDIKKQNNKYLVSTKNTSDLFDYVIISTGSKASSKLGSNNEGYDILKKLNVNITPLKPGLVGIKTKKHDVSTLSGIRQKAIVKLYDNDKVIFEELGEVQFKDEGISGIVVMNASSIIARASSNVNMTLDLLPNYDKEELIEKLKYIQSLNKNISLKELSHGILPKMLANKICDMLKDKLNIKEFVNLSKNYPIKVEGTYGFDNAQICVGGVDLKELNEKLELKKHPYIYATGEVLDIDGLCGGYNLQFAFASGFVAANAIYQKETK